MFRTSLVGCLALMLTISTAQAFDLTDSLREGTPELESIGPLAFGPEGLLFVADPLGAAIFAIDTGDASGDPSSVELNVEGIQDQRCSRFH